MKSRGTPYSFWAVTSLSVAPLRFHSPYSAIYVPQADPAHIEPHLRRLTLTGRSATQKSRGKAVQHDDIAKIIDAAFERRAEIGAATTGAVPEAVDEALDLLDCGAARVAEKRPDGSVHVKQRL